MQAACLLAEGVASNCGWPIGVQESGCSLKRAERAPPDFLSPPPPKCWSVHLLTWCILYLLKHSAAVRGSYFCSAHIKSIQRSYDDKLLHDLNSTSIHVLAGLMKIFLRSLRNPILSHDLWSSFIKASTQEENTKKSPATLVKYSNK